MTSETQLTAAPAPADAAPAGPAHAAPEPAPAADPAPAASTDSIASTEQAWVHPEGWTHDWIDFHGDRLAVRYPNRAAINAVTYLQYLPDTQTQLRQYNRFIDLHVSAASRERVNHRLMDPDDTEYAVYADLSTIADAFGNLGGELIKLGYQRLNDQASALADTETASPTA